MVLRRGEIGLPRGSRIAAAPSPLATFRRKNEHLTLLMTTDEIRVNMTPSHPGDFIRTEVIEELGLSVTEAAAILGVRRATLSDLLGGKAALSPEMALRIEKAFDVSMDMLLKMQAWHDASQMRARESEISVDRYEPA